MRVETAKGLLYLRWLICCGRIFLRDVGLRKRRAKKKPFVVRDFEGVSPGSAFSRP